jgi:HTH-type transcriptional regulator / antitoxin HigA
MTAKTFNLDSYTRLLSEEHPRLPHTSEENDRLIRRVRAIQDKECPSPEELELADVMLALIEAFEDAHYSTQKASPDAILRELMRARGLKPKDLYVVFGSKGTTSEVLRGKRAISRNAAKALAELFHVSASLFL